MKLHQMKREKSESHDQVGNQSARVSLRERFIGSPKMMHVPHPFKRRNTTAIELIEGIQKVTPNSSRQSVRPDLDSKLSVTEMVLQDDIAPETAMKKAQAAARDTHQSPKQMIQLTQGEVIQQVNEDADYKIVNQSTRDSMNNVDIDDEYKS